MTRSSAFMLLVAACSPSSGSSSKPAAAKLERTSLEGLATVTLSGDAEQALGVTVAPVQSGPHPEHLVVGGEVMVPAGRDLLLSAPVGGRISGAVPRPGATVTSGQALLMLVPLATVDRDVRARAQRELDVASSELQLAEARLKRAESMVNDRSGSVRAFEDARAQFQTAVASVASAKSRLQTLSSGALDADVTLVVKSPADGVIRAVRVAAGQSVPPGAPLLEIASTGRWVRTPLSAADAVRTSRGSNASVQRQGSGERVAVTRLEGPPSSDATRGTVDAFFALPAEWAPGERVLVELEVDGEQPRLSVPFESVVRDAEGGAWVFLQTAPHEFRRQRVEVLRRDAERMVLMRGPAVGASVVTAGAVELWGFELGADR